MQIRSREEALGPHKHSIHDHVAHVSLGIALTAAVACTFSLAALVLVILGATRALTATAVLGALAVGAGTAGLALTGYRFLRQQVMTPLNDVVATIRRMESGEVFFPAAPDAPSEFQDLNEALTGLARTVQQQRYRASHQRTRREDIVDDSRHVLQLVHQIASSQDSEHIARLAVDGCMAISGYRRGRLWTVDEWEKELHCQYDSGADVHSASEAPHIAQGESVLGKAVTSAQPVTLPANASADEPAGIAVPMIQGLEVVGVIELRDAAPGKEELSANVEALETLASQAATALANSRLHREIEERSDTDGLTKIYNRRRLNADLRNEVARSRRYGHALTLVMIDVDHFKAINDTYGHHQGDVVLKTVASLLVSECRATDSAYRYGGEEFAVLLRDTGAEAARDVAERLRHRIKDAATALKVPGVVTASLGLAAVSEGADSADELIQAADAALYMAKKQGRDRVVVGV